MHLAQKDVRIDNLLIRLNAAVNIYLQRKMYTLLSHTKTGHVTTIAILYHSSAVASEIDTGDDMI